MPHLTLSWASLMNEQREALGVKGQARPASCEAGKVVYQDLFLDHISEDHFSVKLPANRSSTRPHLFLGISTAYESWRVSRRSPVASWLCAMLYCFGSYILADIMLGDSPIDYFHNNSHILLATALVLVALKEVVRTRKIAAGVHHAHHAYHHGYFVMVITGYVKGSGVALMSNFEQLLRGVWRPESNEILNMSFPTKASLYGAILFTLQEAHWLPVSKATLICLFTLFMATSKVFMTARHSHGSPFALVESWVCHLLFGSPLGGPEDSHDHHHSAPAAASPAKTREELNEGTRKRKAKKAE
ncbi:hypothetical protein JZ751_024644 [Albula glossodonta]|uniref:Trimeric intracellular cation channel type A n=1 Tax=Albula glossodonta TaxID=121402 RepID=A0A8T2PDZ2_9TELE|nr:hypothetical protein JZ751_024644 [Albula glossodonta]